MIVDLRPATAADVPEVVDLVRDVLAEFGLEFGRGAGTDTELLALPESYARQHGLFWVAHEANRLVGTCGIARLDDATFELRKMYLRPDARGLGLGKRLLDEAVEFARRHGARQLVLDTAEQMTRAIAFYEAHGFVRDDAQLRGARCSRGYARTL